MISKAKNDGETCFTYAAKYGNDFKTKDIAVLFTWYEAELKNLNLVVRENVICKFRIEVNPGTTKIQLKSITGIAL